METGWHQQNVAAKASTGSPQVIINFSIISHTPTPHPSAFDFFQYLMNTNYEAPHFLS